MFYSFCSRRAIGPSGTPYITTLNLRSIGEALFSTDLGIKVETVGLGVKFVVEGLTAAVKFSVGDEFCLVNPSKVPFNCSIVDLNLEISSPWLTLTVSF